MFDVNLLFRIKCVEQHDKYDMFRTGNLCFVRFLFSFIKSWMVQSLKNWHGWEKHKAGFDWGVVLGECS